VPGQDHAGFFPKKHVTDGTYGIIAQAKLTAWSGEMDDRTAEKRQTAAAAGTIDRKYGKGRNDDVPRGIICMVVATILFAAASAASKWLVGLYPVGEVLCLRSFASLAAGAAVILPVSGLSAFVTHRPRDHLARGLSQSISQLCLLLAFSLMPLAGAVAINFSARCLPPWSRSSGCESRPVTSEAPHW
jgi:MFS family permease